MTDPEQKLKEKLVKCPYCGEDNFDLIGLKYHLENYCRVYKDTPILEKLIDAENKNE